MRPLVQVFLSLILFFGLLTACRIETTVTVDVLPDGSGEVEVLVTLDDEALKAVETS